jgi:hypothetical protein
LQVALKHEEGEYLLSLIDVGYVTPRERTIRIVAGNRATRAFGIVERQEAGALDKPLLLTVSAGAFRVIERKKG